MNLKRIVRSRIEALAEYVEEHGSGVLSTSDRSTLFSLAQAETYLRFYNGYRREVQEQSIEAGLLPEDDPLFGWGPLGQHEPFIKVNKAEGDPFYIYNPATAKPIHLDKKRKQEAQLQVIRRRHIVPTTPMYILRAIVGPVVIPNANTWTIQNRIARVSHQVTSIGVVEQLNKLICEAKGHDVLVQIGRHADYKIGPIDD